MADPDIGHHVHRGLGSGQVSGQSDECPVMKRTSVRLVPRRTNNPRGFARSTIGTPRALWVGTMATATNPTTTEKQLDTIRKALVNALCAVDGCYDCEGAERDEKIDATLRTLLGKLEAR